MNTAAEEMKALQARGHKGPGTQPYPKEPRTLCGREAQLKQRGQAGWFRSGKSGGRPGGCYDGGG